MADLTKNDMQNRLGNIEQIRDLLMGSQLEVYEQKLIEIEGSVAELKEQTDEKLNKMQGSLSAEIRAAFDSLEKKIKYLSLTTHEKTNNLAEKIEGNEELFTEELESLTKSINNKTTNLRGELEQLRGDVQEDVDLFKNQIFDELVKRFSLLKENKVSRDDLAEVLFELCIKVKGSEFVPDLKEAADRGMQADFLLPDQKPSEEEYQAYEEYGESDES